MGSLLSRELDRQFTLNVFSLYIQTNNMILTSLLTFLFVITVLRPKTTLKACKLF